MKKVLQSLGSLNMGGAETMIVNVLKAMDKSVVGFDFVIPGAEPGYYEDCVKQLGASVWHIPKRSESFLRHHLEFYRVVKCGGYKTVHIHTQNAFFSSLQVFLVHRAGAKCVIVHSHNTMDWRSGKIVKLHKLCRKWLYRHTDIRLACGKEAAKWLFGTMQGVEIIPLPVDCDRLFFEKKKQQLLKKEYGLEHKKVYLHVGRFSAVKNHRFLLEVFEQIKKTEPDSVLLLAGDGELREEIKAQAQKSPFGKDIRFLGNISNVPEMMVLSDVFLFPSIYEGLPTVLLEAQAAGLPCFVSDRITQEAKLTDQVHMLSLDDGAEKWAQVITDTKLAAERISGNRKVRETYDISAVVQKMTALYLQNKGC